MKNISGNVNYGVLAPGKQESKKNESKVTKKVTKPLNLSLITQIRAIEEHYKTNPSKHLSDALVNLRSAETSLKKNGLKN